MLIVAGEPSGDVIGGLLITALRRLSPLPVAAFGVGGERMLAAGLTPLFPQSDLAVMGLAEVLPRLPRILSRLSRLVAAATAAPPDVVVTIDSSSFNRRLVRRLRRAGIGAPMVHYVAPMVWAWRSGRAARMAAEFDRLLTLFPFEPPLFEAHGLQTDRVGHPAVELPLGDGAGFRERYAIPPDAPLLCVLPGSRAGELDRLLGPFGGAVALVSASLPGLRVAVPTLPHLFARVAAAAVDWPGVEVVATETDRRDAIAASDAALAASGTVTLDVAAAGVPMVVGYRLNPATAWVGRRLIRVDHVALPNILLREPLVPEFLQGECRPAALAAPMLELLCGGEAALAQRRGLAAAMRRLGIGETPPPSHRAAAIILSLATAAGRPQIRDGT